MSQRWYIRAALAAAIGLGVVAGLARAQGTGQPPAPAPVAAPAPAPDQTPWTVIERGAGYVPPPVEAIPAETPPAPRQGICGRLRTHVANSLHKHGLGCYSHHDAFLCSSWQSEKTFIFGSCREFYGEPCLPPPPGGVGPAGGVGAAGAGCSRCK